MPSGHGNDSERVGSSVLVTRLTECDFSSGGVDGIGSDEIGGSGCGLGDGIVGRSAGRGVSCQGDVVRAGLVLGQVVVGLPPRSQHLALGCEAQLRSHLLVGRVHSRGQCGVQLP